MTVPEFTTLDALVEAFDKFQRNTRGLRPRTLHGYAALMRKFVRDVLGEFGRVRLQLVQTFEARVVRQQRVTQRDAHITQHGGVGEIALPA